MKRFGLRRWAILLASIAALLPLAASANGGGSFIGPLNTMTPVASTVPANGDVNPYGVAIVPRTMGNLVRGDILVSNFNNSANLQGTGTTIVEIAPNGSMTLFAQLSASNLHGACPGGVGLTTALVALRQGWVIVGSLPTTDGTSATAQAGCLIVLNSHGQAVETISGGPINGPWDMTAVEDDGGATLFVTNVLNGTVAGNGNVVNQGTVVRIRLSLPDQGNPHVTSETVIGSGFPEKTDPAALVIGPTGVGLGENGTLYVADTQGNRIAAIPGAMFRRSSAGTGRTVSQGGSLNGPLGLTIAPNHDIVVANASDGNLVEVTPRGQQVATKLAESAGAGSLFGLAIAPNRAGVYYVDDSTNALNLLH